MTRFITCLKLNLLLKVPSGGIPTCPLPPLPLPLPRPPNPASPTASGWQLPDEDSGKVQDLKWDWVEPHPLFDGREYDFAIIGLTTVINR